MEARQAPQVVLQKGKKGSFSVNVKKKKNNKKPPTTISRDTGESCQVMIDVLLSTGVSGQRDISFCSRSVTCGYVSLAK